MSKVIEMGYSSLSESSRILDLLLGTVDEVSLPPEAASQKSNVEFTVVRDQPYFPIPFKETEVSAALKAIEGSVAAALADLQDGSRKGRKIHVSLEKTTAFLFQAYLARVGGLGKLDKEVRKLLKGAFELSRGDTLDHSIMLMNTLVCRHRSPPSPI